MNKPLIFIGSRVNLPEMTIAAESFGHEILGILDSQYWGNTDQLYGIPIIGDERWLMDANHHEAQQWRQHCLFHVATFHNGQQQSVIDDSNSEMLRWKRIQMTAHLELDMMTLIHPDARVTGIHSRYSSVTIGRGTYISSGVTLSLHHVTIGDHCSIGAGTMIGHDCHIGTNTIVGPNCHVFYITIGDNSYIGMHSMVDWRASRRQNLTVGSWSTIWAHTMIKNSVPDNHMLTPQGRCWKKYRPLPCTQDPAVDQ